MRLSFGAEFDVTEPYLDTAAVGVPPRQVVDAVRESVDGWASGKLSAADFDAPIATARAAFGTLVGVEPESVAIGSSTSAMLALVAAAVPEGATVVVPAGEFTSVSFPFAAHASRGVVVEEVPLDAVPDAARNADFVAASVVQSADGRILDLEGLRAATRGSGTRVVLDATQSLGWYDGPIGWADAVVASGYKWLLSPRGSAWMSLSDALAGELTPLAASWFAGEHPLDSLYGLPLRLAGSARRFDYSPAWIPNAGAAAALPWLASLDRREVHSHCVGLADSLLTELGHEPRGSAIVSIDLGDKAKNLMDAGIRAGSRDGRTRFAFYLHNNADDVQRVLDALA